MQLGRMSTLSSELTSVENNEGAVVTVYRFIVLICARHDRRRFSIARTPLEYGHVRRR